MKNVNDFSKHAPIEVVPRIHMVWQSIPMQLAKENKKFIYGIIREGARAKEFELAIQWLLAARGDLDARVLLEGNRVFEEFKGALTEQFAAQQLTAGGMDLYYYSKENSTGELDFMVQRGMHVIPLEVKAEENLQAKSLRAYCEKYQPEIAVRTSMSNYREQDWTTNVPLYALSSYLRKID